MEQGPQDQGPDERDSRSVASGAVLGALLGFFVLPTPIYLFLSSVHPDYRDSDVYLGIAVPGVLGLLMLVRPRLRAAGAGVLLGLALGLVLGSGACLAYLGSTGGTL